jgi:hypothetical protein
LRCVYQTDNLASLATQDGRPCQAKPRNCPVSWSQLPTVVLEAAASRHIHLSGPRPWCSQTLAKESRHTKAMRRLFQTTSSRGKWHHFEKYMVYVGKIMFYKNMKFKFNITLMSAV